MRVNIRSVGGAKQLLSAALAFCVFTPDAKALDFWLTEPIADVVRFAVDLERQTNITITPTTIRAEDMTARLAIAQITHQTPDVIIVPSDQLQQPEVKVPRLPAMLIGSVEPELLNENDTGVALGIGQTVLLYYKKNLVNAPTSWEEIQNPASGEPALAIDLFIPFFSIPFYINNGLFDEHNRTSQHAAEAVIAGMQAVKELQREGFLSPRCGMQPCLAEEFVLGDVPYAFAGSWSYQILKEALGDNLGVVAIPPRNGQPMLPVRFPPMLAVGKDPDSPEDQRAILTLFDALNQIDRHPSLFGLYGPSPMQPTENLPEPWNFVKAGSITTKDDGFTNCVLTISGRILDAYLEDRLDNKGLEQQVREHVVGNTCRLGP